MNADIIVWEDETQPFREVKLNTNAWDVFVYSKNTHIRMISEGSCDTEDWSNDAENSALITEINYMLIYIHNFEL